MSPAKTKPKSAKPAGKKRETRIEATRHRDTGVNIPTEEHRDFVADGEKTPGSGLQW